MPRCGLVPTGTGRAWSCWVYHSSQCFWSWIKPVLWSNVQQRVPVHFGQGRSRYVERSGRTACAARLHQAAGPGDHGERHPAALLLQHGHQRRVAHSRCRQAVDCHDHIAAPRGTQVSVSSQIFIRITFLFQYFVWESFCFL